ncbi:hypothetical protein V1478_014906 [Vespula squamosa]|uniref:Uncharacterized protein n=1 Tax=Vespula squamosa TaxID=30214 RepID=A0ABD2A3M0_VESSQ
MVALIHMNIKIKLEARKSESIPTNYNSNIINASQGLLKYYSYNKSVLHISETAILCPIFCNIPDLSA